MKTVIAAVYLTFIGCVSSHAQTSNQCFDAIQSNPATTAIHGKVAFVASDLNDFKFMVNAEKVATDEQRMAIGVFVEERRKCEQLVQLNIPEMASLRRSQMAQIEANAAELYMGKISYGEFTNFRRKMFQEMTIFQEQWQKNQKARTEQLDMQRRQAIRDYIGNQPAPPAVTPIDFPKSTYTNCNWVGKQLNCITR